MRTGVRCRCAPPVDDAALGSVPPIGGNSYLGNSFNPNSASYQRASAAYRRYAVAEPVTPAGAAKVQAAQLKYAHCMRAHGVTDFPDPSANGGFTIPESTDENGPLFQAAERACKGDLPNLSPPDIGDSRR